MIRLETFIRDAFIKKEHVVAVFFDLEKAYDTTWRYGILRDLHELGLKGRLPVFIKSFLADRRMQVRVGSTLSEQFEQAQGVPQGSILSTTLFNMKINDIVNCLDPKTDWGADRKVLLHLYRTIVRSKLDYGSIVYGSARESYLKTLDTIHHQGIRLALGAFRTSPADSLLVEANEPE